jgi:hypothetical protein
LDLSAANANVPEPDVPAFDWLFAAIDEETTQGWSKNDVKCLLKIHQLLRHSIISTDNEATEQAFKVLGNQLKKKNMKSLQFVCGDLCCTSPGRQPQKSHYAEALVQWCRTQPLSSQDPPLPYTVNPAVIDCIWEVMQDVVKPLWINSLPSDLPLLFGTKATGSFKADEWHTFFTIFLPISLVSLWRDATLHSSQRTADHLRQVLDHTMYLVCAVLVAGS